MCWINIYQHTIVCICICIYILYLYLTVFTVHYAMNAFYPGSTTSIHELNSLWASQTLGPVIVPTTKKNDCRHPQQHEQHFHTTFR